MTARIKITIVVVLVMVPVGAQVDVVDPNLVRLLNANVVSRSQDLSNLEISDDDIARVQNTETNTSER